MPLGTRGLSREEKILTNIIIDVSSGCWCWVAYVAPNGYGQIRINGKLTYAHRVSYESFVGAIPQNLEIDHKCRNRACANPWHLEPVSRKTNAQRGKTRTGRFYTDPICTNGHDMNLVGRTKRNQCRQCDIEYQRALRKKSD